MHAWQAAVDAALTLIFISRLLHADIVPVYHLGSSQMLRCTGSSDWSRRMRMSVCLFWGRWGLPLPYKHDILSLVGTPVRGDLPRSHFCWLDSAGAIHILGAKYYRGGVRRLTQAFVQRGSFCRFSSESQYAYSGLLFFSHAEERMPDNLQDVERIYIVNSVHFRPDCHWCLCMQWCSRMILASRRWMQCMRALLPPSQSSLTPTSTSCLAGRASSSPQCECWCALEGSVRAV